MVCVCGREGGREGEGGVWVGKGGRELNQGGKEREEGEGVRVRRR